MNLAIKKNKIFIFFLFFCLIVEDVISGFRLKFNVPLIQIIAFYGFIGCLTIFLVGRKIGVLLSGLMVLLIHIASRIKHEQTGEPLGYYDLMGFENFSIVKSYVEYYHVLVLLVFFGILFKFRRNIFYSNKKKFFNWKYLIFAALFFIFTLPFSKTNAGVIVFKNNYSAEFQAWDWGRNVKINGLANHLYMTRNVFFPKRGNYIKNKNDINIISVSENKLNNIIFVMCESCWEKENEVGFSVKLRAKGFKKFNLISPVYGGGTVNSAFEILTGMSSKSHLTGTIYQTYADHIKDNVMSYPNMLRNLDYSATKLHNNKKSFWRRHLVAPKIGFENFYGIESMRDLDWDSHPRDFILYEKGMEIFKSKYETQKNFMFLTTIYSHGRYKENNGDFGFGDYSSRVNQSVDDFLDFFENVKNLDPNVTVVFFGDHKPGLNEYFNKSGYEVIFRDEKLKGKVPAFIYGNKVSDEFVDYVDNSSMYCFSYKFSKKLNGLMNLPMKFHEDNGYCKEYLKESGGRVLYNKEFYYDFLLN